MRKARVSKFSLLSEAERHEQLVVWNATQAAYPQDQCLHELVEAQAAQRPDAVAGVWGAQHLTYAALNRRANQLAHQLRAWGVGPEVRVGLCLERSVDLLVGLLGILKAGGAYVPLDPTYPAERLAFMLADTQTPVVVTQPRCVAALPASTAQVVCLDTAWEARARAGAAPTTPASTAAHLAYVMYTSGSTGVPKGVAIPQQAISRLVWNTNYITLTPADPVEQASNMSFDAATFEIWGALLHGARLVGLAREVSLDPATLATQLRRQQIRVLFVTTALFNQVARGCCCFGWRRTVSATGVRTLRRRPCTILSAS